MDAQSWDECEDPEPLFVILREKLSEQVAWRLACAFCRQLWHRLDGPYRIGRAVIETREGLADNTARLDELQALQQEYLEAAYQSHRKLGHEDPLVPIRYLLPGRAAEGTMRTVAKAVRQAMPKKQRAAARMMQAAQEAMQAWEPTHNPNPPCVARTVPTARGKRQEIGGNLPASRRLRPDSQKGPSRGKLARLLECKLQNIESKRFATKSHLANLEKKLAR